MADWNSNQYLKFEKERTQPSADLISRLSDINPNRVLDIGCGPGNSTNLLAKRFKNAEILGVDSSDNMLEKAKATYPDFSFKKCILPNDFDKIDGKFDQPENTALDGVWYGVWQDGRYMIARKRDDVKTTQLERKIILPEPMLHLHRNEAV